MKLVRRSQWGGPTSIGSRANPTRGCVAHYNGGPIGLKGRPHSACLDYVRRVHRQHLNQSWAGIGYSFLACPHGCVIEGRGLGRAQAAQPGGNTTHYSIQMMVGGNEEPTAVQVQAWRDARAYIRANRSVSAHVGKHSDFIATSCAGVPTNRLLASGALGGSGSSTPVSGGMTSVRPVGSQQTLVNAAGYSPRLIVDDLWGPLTDAGVRWYQHQLGVTVDGLWGPATDAAHKRKAGAPSKPAPAPSVPRWPGVYFRTPPITRHDSVRIWQSRMRARGWSIIVDGAYGPASQRVCRQFQQEKRLSVDGIVGPATWKAAWSAPVT